MNPPTDCISPIGEELILKSLKKQIPNAGFHTAVSRAPSVYRGNPFAVEVGLAYGGRAEQADDEESRRGEERGGDAAGREGEAAEEQPITLLRFANRVPLLYQQSACAIWKSVVTTDWRNYGLTQPSGALPLGPMTLMVHVASVWVPFTSESKEAVAHYPEIIKEIRLALQECGRQLYGFLRRRHREADEARKRSEIEKFMPHIAIALKDILRLKQKQEGRIVSNLKHILEKSRG
jgi:DNA topoisomerase-6 subunit B